MTAKFDLEVPIARDSAGVAHWWLDFPAIYTSDRRREQPYRIETTSRTDRRIEIRTFWKMMGMRFRFQESIQVVGPLAFDAEILMGPIVVNDTFRIEDDGNGASKMRIHTVVAGRGVLGVVMAPMIAPILHRWMKRIWADAARLCAEDGRKAAAALGPNAPSQ
ncbi:MAG: hypothetical protein HY556_02355 [Euryarchaeota archaeon]|nr:hypothetical protein [Euryarchaeota archaeon]